VNRKGRHLSGRIELAAPFALVMEVPAKAEAPKLRRELFAAADSRDHLGFVAPRSANRTLACGCRETFISSNAIAGYERGSYA